MVKLHSSHFFYYYIFNLVPVDFIGLSLNTFGFPNNPAHDQYNFIFPGEKS